MERSRIAVMMYGHTSGIVTYPDCCSREAPSIRAASYGSVGSTARPPSTISITNGVHCHVSTIARVAITDRGE